MVVASLFWISTVACVRALLQIVAVVGLGIGATFGGLFSETSISDLGRLVYFVSLPALIFSNVVVNVSLPTLRLYWIAPAFCCLHVGTALVVTRLLARAFRLTPLQVRARCRLIQSGSLQHSIVDKGGSLLDMCGPNPNTSSWKELTETPAHAAHFE